MVGQSQDQTEYVGNENNVAPVMPEMPTRRVMLDLGETVKSPCFWIIVGFALGIYFTRKRL